MAQKPAKGNNPTLARAPIIMAQKVMGSFLRRPPMRRMSCSPDMEWITEPEPRNSSPLKKPWANR